MTTESTLQQWTDIYTLDDGEGNTVTYDVDGVGEAALIWTSQDSIAALIRELARAFKVGVLSSAYGLAKSAQGKAIKQTPHYGYTIFSRLRELGVSHVLADYPHSTELLTIAELYRRINGELED